MLKEFKTFLMKGNLIDLAVAFVLGVAFASVVSAFTVGVVGGLVAALVGKQDLVLLTFRLGNGVIRYGVFLESLIDFVTVGFVLFLIVKAYNRFRAEPDLTTKACAFCRTDIPLDATRCPNCTSELQAA